MNYGCFWVLIWWVRIIHAEHRHPLNDPQLLTLIALIAEIDQFKGASQALGSLAPERLNALRKVATIESIGSSTRIEGSRLSDREVEHSWAGWKSNPSSHGTNEVAGYAEVMDLIFHAWPDIKITENHIRQLHRDLLAYSVKDEWHRGNYKTSSNSVAAFDENGRQIGIVFETTTPYDTPRLMAELLDWLNEVRGTGRPHPVLTIAVFVVVFLEIHPFSRWQWPFEPGTDHSAPAAIGLCLRSLWLLGKHHRTK